MVKFSASRVAPFVLFGLLAAGGWYASQTGTASGNGECHAATTLSERLKPLAKGEIAALTLNTSKPAPVVSFVDGAEQPRTLADFKGRTILVNLWATWCVPCREEMPALDALQAAHGGPDFEVVAINVDTRASAKPKTWLEQNGIDDLAYYADPTGKLLQNLQKSGHAVGLPTTLLVDASGCELAILKGPAEWASPDALAFIKAALSKD